MEADRLASYRILRREDGKPWSLVLDPILRDTAGLPVNSAAHLEALDGLINQLMNGLTRYRLPEFVVYQALKGERVTPIAYLSALVAHRAERLIQACELLAGALRSLELGMLQLSAISARALLEIGTVCWDMHRKILERWRQIHGSRSGIRAEVNSTESALFRNLWETRMGSRFYEADEGWPQAKSVLGPLRRLEAEVPRASELYHFLCDATHPNVEAQALLWRTDYISVGENAAIRFAPGDSNSKVKLYIADSVLLSLQLIIPFTQDLWWIAADITNACDITPTPKTEPLAIPVRTARNEPCSCGSGEITRVCTHPEPSPTP